MDLEQMFVNSHILQRFREGPLEFQLEGFFKWLNKFGFTNNTIRIHVSHLSHFNLYLKKSGLTDWTSINSDHIRAFVTDHLSRCTFGRKDSLKHNRVASSVHRFMKYLQESELVESTNNHKAPHMDLLDDYIKWMKDYHNLAPGSLILRRKYLVQFLNYLGADSTPERLSLLSSEKIQNFSLNYSRDHGQAARRSMQATLRTFFQFCLIQGYVLGDLSQAVPTLRTYKLDKLPRGIEDGQAQQLLSSINRNTDVGKRDYAIIQLLYTYGIRGGQIRSLCLDDLNWTQNTIRFSALKHGKEVLQPLTDNVGESLLDYLKQSRPQLPYPEVFLTACAPFRPLPYSSTLSRIVARNMRAAGITSPTYGAHTFRHSFATRLLEKGHSLKSIADMIGHRSIQSTFIYTKVDFQTLNQVALDWPEEEI
ncbi:MAG: site-specific integrase [Candidatus Ranarchaeia archaeon]|jgi:site-specific recombinase XerD